MNWGPNLLLTAEVEEEYSKEINLEDEGPHFNNDAIELEISI